MIKQARGEPTLPHVRNAGLARAPPPDGRAGADGALSGGGDADPDRVERRHLVRECVHGRPVPAVAGPGRALHQRARGEQHPACPCCGRPGLPRPCWALLRRRAPLIAGDSCHLGLGLRRFLGAGQHPADAVHVAAGQAWTPPDAAGRVGNEAAEAGRNGESTGPGGAGPAADDQLTAQDRGRGDEQPEASRTGSSWVSAARRWRNAMSHWRWSRTRP